MERLRLRTDRFEQRVKTQIYCGAPVAQWVERWSSGREFEPRSRRNLLNRERGFIAHSLSLSTFHRPDIPEILLNRTWNRKSSIHPRSIAIRESSWLTCSISRSAKMFKWPCSRGFISDKIVLVTYTSLCQQCSCNDQKELLKQVKWINNTNIISLIAKTIDPKLLSEKRRLLFRNQIYHHQNARCKSSLYPQYVYKFNP